MANALRNANNVREWKAARDTIRVLNCDMRCLMRLQREMLWRL